MTNLFMSFVSSLRRNYYAIFHHCVADTPEKFKDAPVGLQLLARPQEDEAVLGMGEIIDKALASYKANL